MLNGGGLNDQPAWYVGAMQLIHGLSNRAEMERIKAAQDKPHG